MSQNGEVNVMRLASRCKGNNIDVRFGSPTAATVCFGRAGINGLVSIVRVRLPETAKSKLTIKEITKKYGKAVGHVAKEVVSSVYGLGVTTFELIELGGNKLALPLEEGGHLQITGIV